MQALNLYDAIQVESQTTRLSEQQQRLASRPLKRRMSISTKRIGTVEAILTTENPKTADEI